MDSLHPIQLDPIITRALEEDWGYGDWTTDLCVPANGQSVAKLVAKEDTVVAGLEVAEAVFKKVDNDLKVSLKSENGADAPKGTVLLTVSGRSRSILKGERVMINLTARMCGIAYMSRQYVARLEGSKTQLLDTRKTTPGLRILEKSATTVGGARNHRFGLCDGVMVKDNHIRAAGSITAALDALLGSLPPTLKIEVETTCLAEVKEALAAGADIIMLDNMPPAQMKEAVDFIAGRALVEASGNITIDNLADVAATGVDFVSTSAVITRAKWADLSLQFEPS